MRNIPNNNYSTSLYFYPLVKMQALLSYACTVFERMFRRHEHCIFHASAYVGAFFNWRVKMNIKTELLKGYFADYITKSIDDFDIDADEICKSISCEALKKS